MNATLARFVLGSWASASGAVGVVLVALGVGGLALSELVRAPSSPGLAALPAVVAALVPVALEPLVPLAGSLGWLLVASRWHADGAWLGLRASGARGRDLLPWALVAAAGCAAATAVVTLELAPTGRRATLALLADAVEPLPGRPLRVGDATLVVGGAGPEGWTEVFLGVAGQGPPQVLVARRGRRSGDRLVLEDGEVDVPGRDGGPGVRASFRRLEVPLPTSVVELPHVALDDAALRARAAELRAAALRAGGAAGEYAEAIRRKRRAFPVAGAAWVLAGLPLSLARRGAWLGVGVVAWWAAVRTCDHMVGVLGAGPSAWLPTALVWVGALAVWASWRDR